MEVCNRKKQNDITMNTNEKEQNKGNGNEFKKKVMKDFWRKMTTKSKLGTKKFEEKNTTQPETDWS